MCLTMFFYKVWIHVGTALDFCFGGNTAWGISHETEFCEKIPLVEEKVFFLQEAINIYFVLWNLSMSWAYFSSKSGLDIWILKTFWNFEKYKLFVGHIKYFLKGKEMAKFDSYSKPITKCYIKIFLLCLHNVWYVFYDVHIRYVLQNIFIFRIFKFYN